MKTRLPMIFTIVLLVGLLVTACGLRIINGSGKVMTESRPVSDFTAVNFSGIGELTLIQGESEALTIQGRPLPLVVSLHNMRIRKGCSICASTTMFSATMRDR